jgi:hypothetical protein
VARSRQILLVKLLRAEADDEPALTILSSVPMGSFKSVVDQLGRYNTAPDGGKSPENYGMLYGPGFIAQLPMVGPDDPVAQVMISLTEEEIAWPVLMRICRNLELRMMDPQSGRTFGGG